VVDSLRASARGDIPTPTARRQLMRSLRAAGNAAVPALLRSFASEIETESSWAYYLLGRLGGVRVVRAMDELLADPDLGDDVKARALGLLSDIGAPVPDGVALRNPDALLQKSVRDLLGTLDRPRDMAQAVRLIGEQVPAAELPAFAAELVRHGGRRAVPLVDALAARDGLDDDTRAALAALKREARRGPAERRMDDTLERGLEYLESGRPKAARPRLERFVATCPERADGRSALGVCLLELRDFDGAITELRAAADLEPAEALHRWNVAAACKQADRLGGAYLALRDYLATGDDGTGATERRREAKSFVRAYERMLQDCHPGVELTDYLRGEELFARAYAALVDGRPEEALGGFRAVLDLVPRHYPSWGNLGAAYLALERRSEAAECLNRALELNPEYTVARKNLSLIET
jgi:tetratricopeptide (TPR) repeat protein